MIYIALNMFRKWVGKCELSGRIAWAASWSVFWLQMLGSFVCIALSFGDQCSACPNFVPGLPQWALYVLGRSLPCCWVKDFFNSFHFSILLYWQRTSFFPLSLGLKSWSSCLCLPRAKITYMHHHPWLNLCGVWQLPSRCIFPLVLNLKSQLKLKLLNWRKG